MNLRLRLIIIRICLWKIIARYRLALLNIYALKNLVNLAMSVGKAREKWRFKPYKKAVSNLVERSTSFLLGLRTLDELTEADKRRVLAARSSLLEEHNNLLTVCRNWVSVPPRGTAAFMYLLQRARKKAVRWQRNSNVLSRIGSRIRSRTFYWDLLLWLGGCSEELLGDLNEEYLLRVSSDGEAAAMAWYCDQAITTIWDYLWGKIEHLAAIGALIDFVDRWFKK